MSATNSIILTSQKNNESEQQTLSHNETNINAQCYNLYPQVSSQDNPINNDVPFIQWDFNQEKKKYQEEEQINDVYEMNDEFFESLIQRKNYFEKNKTLNTICNFIRNSKLIKKLESEYSSDKKMDSENLVLNCAKSLGYVKLEEGEILFKIGDIGEKFYFILKGKINILKLKELKNIFMTNVEYLQYCLFLDENKEDYILNEVFKKNKKIFNVTNIEDIVKLYRIIFIKILREEIANHSVENNRQLLKFFSDYKQELSSFHIIEADLNHFELQKEKGIYGSAKDWENYILKRVRTNIKEAIFFEEYEGMFKDRTKKYNIICYIYESFLYFGPGLFFGDFALDSENAKRNATIRAEEKTYLAWMKSLDYVNIIAPRRKIEKYNEIMFLYKNYFFKTINVFTFEKKYFHLFPPREFVKGDIIYTQNTIPNGLYFIKTGQIQLEIKASAFELQFIIEQIFERMIKSKYYKLVTKVKGSNYLMDLPTLKKVRRILKEPFLKKTTYKNAKLIQELNKKVLYKFSIITQNELIGIEEIFLGIGYLSSGEVISDKVVCYELSETQLNTFLEEEKNLSLLYTKYAVNKILALLDYLQNIRKNRIYISKNKHDNIQVLLEKNIMEENMGLNKINDNNEIKDENNKEEENKNENELNSININKKEFGNVYPLTNEAKINIKKILKEKNPERYMARRDRLLHSKIKRKLEINNQKKIFQKKHFSFFNDLNEDKKKNSKENSNNDLFKYIIPSINNNKDSLLVGNKCIKANKIKEEMQGYNFYMSTKNMYNSQIYNSSNLNSDSYSQIFELSQLRYPLSDRVIEKNDNTSKNDSLTLYNKYINKNISNDFKETEKNYFIKRIRYTKSQKFFGRIKKRNAGNNTTLTKTLSLSRKKNQINIINLNEEQFGTKTKKKLIRKKELLPGIIKDFDKKIKDKVMNSYLKIERTNKPRINDNFENKKDKEYNINDLKNILPNIFENKSYVN